MQGAEDAGVTNGSENGCTDGCTRGEHKSASDGGNAAGAAGAGGAGEHFAEAVAMLARLPLTDAERAEAVRRLLRGESAQP